MGDFVWLTAARMALMQPFSCIVKGTLLEAG